MKFVVLWYVMPCSLVQVARRFVVTCCHHYQSTCRRFNKIGCSLKSLIRFTFDLNEWNWNANVNHCSLNQRPLVFILSQMIPIFHPVSLSLMFILSSHPCLCLPCGLFLSNFPIKILLHYFQTCPMSPLISSSLI